GLLPRGSIPPRLHPDLVDPPWGPVYEPLLFSDRVAAVLRRLRLVGTQSKAPLVVTNGTRINPGMALKLAELAPGLRYKISVGRVPAANSDGSAGSDPWSGISLLRRMGAEVEAQVTIADSSEELVELFSYLCCSDVFRATTTPVDWLPSESGIMLEQRPLALEKMLSDAAWWVARQAASGQLFDWTNMSDVVRKLYYSCRQFKPCPAGESSFALDGSGYLYPCFRFVGRRRYALGHVRSGLDEGAVAWFSRAAALSLEDHCGTCELWGLCPGRCYFALLEMPSAANPFCAFERALIAACVRISAALRHEDPAAYLRVADFHYSPLEHAIQAIGGAGRETAGVLDTTH
ncbi:MAG: SPASM domain-containing protein, partial [Acetobacteraceae bacterium]|nr:SPASM domain-containing protein [Acetobacteraceae bacterium]